MRSQTFHSVATRFAQTIGRSQGINLIFKGERAMTDGKKIILPALPPGLTLKESESQILMGYLDHEVGHIKHSNFQALTDWRRRNKPTPVCKHLVNIFEDVREEARYIDEYSGARHYLDATHSHTHRMDMRSITEQGGFKSWGEAALAVIYVVSFKHPMRNFTNFILPLSLKDLDLEPVGAVIEKGLSEATGIEDIITLAEEVEKLVREKAQEQPKVPSEDGSSDPFAEPPDGAGEDQTGGDSDPSDSDDEDASDSVKDVDNASNNPTDGSEQKKDGQSDEKSDSEDQGQNGSGDGKGESSDDQAGGSSKSGSQDRAEDENGDGSDAQGGDGDEDASESILEAEDAATDPQKELDAAAQARDEATDNSHSLDEFLKGLSHDKAAELTKVDDTGGHDTPDMFKGNSILPPGDGVIDKIFEEGHRNDAEYARLRSACSSEITAMKKMLSTFLRSREHKAWSRGLDEGRLDSSALWGLKAGNRRVYKQKRSRTMVNTAVSVMIDCSGSMEERLTRQAAIILCESLGAVPKVKVQISGFTTDAYSYCPDQADRGRLENLQVPVYKRFDESYAQARGKLGGIQFPGCTPLGEGYLYGFETLIGRDETRRILWVITDGEPYYSTGSNDHNDWLLIKRAQLLCRKNGIETIGFGIGRSTNRIGNYTDRYGHANGFGDLQKAILEMLRNTLAQSVV